MNTSSTTTIITTTVNNTESESLAQLVQEPTASTAPPTTTEAKQLDLVFLMDCTASMGEYIQAAKRTIQSIIQTIVKSEKCDVRFGLVAYRDHPPQDTSYVTKTFEFIRDTRSMQANLDQLSAAGGGDGPEAVTAGLHAAANLDYRPDATKICILIADAPPHGLGESGDGFPNGDPDGLDPLVIARSMAESGITIYSVGCEPALSQYRFARGFLVALADITEGQAVSLASSALLADVILGGAMEELGLQSLAAEYEQQIAQINEEVTSSAQYRDATAEVQSAEVCSRVYAFCKEKGVHTSSMKTDGRMEDMHSVHFVASPSLSVARETVAAIAPPPRKEFSRRSLTSSACYPVSDAPTVSRPAWIGGGGDFDDNITTGASAPISHPRSATSCVVAAEEVSMEQASKMVSKSRKAGRL